MEDINNNDYTKGYADGITFIMNFFERRAKGKPTRHGHWTEDCRCSECGAEAITAWNETGGAWVMTPFCPFCGAEMEMSEEIVR